MIHSHDPQLGFLLKLTSRIPALLTIHGPAFDTSQMRFYKKLIAVSQSVRSDIETRSTNKCEVIYNGVNAETIKHRDTLSLQKIINVILVGRLDHLVKGQDLAIEAVHCLVRDKQMKNLSLSLVGEGISRKYLEELILNQNLAGNVVLLGNRDREWVYANLCRYDLLIQPSRLEGFGLTVAEAMAAKVPVIATNIEGPAEILENGRYGLLFENNNALDLAAKIENAIQLIENGQMIKMTEPAYRYILDNFSIARTAKEYCSQYDRLYKSK